MGSIILIDWVAVKDMERVLSMSPVGIDHIELVNSAYIKGNITYGGIISFISKKSDFAGIDLPKSGTFINYKFLEECQGIEPSETLRANMPDSRNTVYWAPDFQTDNNSYAEIKFTAPDTPGKYVVLLRGLSSKGGEVMIKEEFEVINHSGH